MSLQGQSGSLYENSVQSQCDPSLLPGRGPRPTFKLLLWNNFPETESNTFSFIPGQNGDGEALCPLEYYRNVFGRERCADFLQIVIF